MIVEQVSDWGEGLEKVKQRHHYHWYYCFYSNRVISFLLLFFKRFRSGYVSP